MIRERDETHDPGPVGPCLKMSECTPYYKPLKLNHPVTTCGNNSREGIVAKSWLALPSLVPQPSYNPDLAPSDVWLCPKLKETLKGQRFTMDAEMDTQPTRILLHGRNEEIDRTIEHMCSYVC
ncbi:hypothetical protein TNCV_5116211 [Trichonephila clavipes]|nr:hypothetical protein TNCV_5116211 [Trichonephila clavipes]